jgi:hypothetical protein
VQERRVVMDHDRVSTIINFNAPIMHYYDHPTTVYVGKGEYVEAEEVKGIEGIPSHERLCRAIEQTMEDGLWWASTAWAVVFRVYQMKGYMGSISQFVREVDEWEWKRSLAYQCSYDSVQKPIVSGKLSGNIEKWKEEGVMEQMIKLGNALLDLLK